MLDHSAGCGPCGQETFQKILSVDLDNKEKEGKKKYLCQGSTDKIWTCVNRNALNMLNCFFVHGVYK